jgi:hypothetical protein
MGADSIAAPPMMAAVVVSMQPPAEKLAVDTAAVLRTAMREVPVTISAEGQPRRHPSFILER